MSTALALLLLCAVLYGPSSAQCVLPAGCNLTDLCLSSGNFTLIPSTDDYNASSGTTNLLVGTFMPLTGGNIGGISMLPMIQMVFNDVNANATLLPDHTIKWINWDTSCNAATALDKSFQAFTNYPRMVGIIGEICSVASEPIALLSRIFNMTQISPASTSPTLSNKVSYPWFSRVVTPDDSQGLAWLAIAKKFGWKTMNTITSRANLHNLLTEAFVAAALAENLTLASSQNFPDQIGFDMTPLLDNIKKTGVNLIFVACYANDLRTLLRQAEPLGMTGPPYVWIFTDASTGPSLLREDPGDPAFIYPEYVLNYDYELSQGYEHLVQGNILTNPGSTNSTLRAEVRARYFQQNPTLTPATVHTYLDYAYDAAYTMVYGLQYMFYERSPPWTGPVNGIFRAELYHYIVNNTNFVGITPGRVQFDEFGDRQGPFDLLYFDNGTKLLSASWSPATDTWTENMAVKWPDGTRNVPPDQAPLTYYYINPVLQIVFMTLGCAAMVIVILFFILTLVYWNNSRIIAATPTFMLLICFSTLMALSIILVIGVYPSDATCVIPHWFGHVAFYLTFSCLFFKTFRVWMIFSALDPKKKSMGSPIVITNAQLLAAAILPVVGVMIYLACFTALGQPHVIYTIEVAEPRVVYVSCYFDTNWIIALYLPEALLLLLCLILAWQCRKIELLRFNESSHISICIYCLLIIGVILVPNVHWLSTDTNTQFVLEAVCIIIACLTINFALFLPKFKAILAGKVDSDQVESMGTTKGSSNDDVIISMKVREKTREGGTIN